MKRYVFPVLLFCLLISMTGCKNKSGSEEMKQTANSSSYSNVSSQSQSNPISLPLWIPSEPIPNKEDRFPDDHPEANTAWTPVDTIEVTGAYADTFPVVTNETPLEGMLSEMNNYYLPMSYMVDMQVLYPHDYERYRMDASPSLERIVKGETWDGFLFHIPVNFLRKTGPGQYYTVCKQKDGGYVYIFFDRPRELSDPSRYSSTDETNVFLYGVLYAEKSLSRTDFDEVAAGDSIDKVISIDTAAALVKTLMEWKMAEIEQPSYTGDCSSSIHLLTDGILEIQYAVSDGKLYVKDMLYYKDFMYLASGAYQYFGEEIHMNLKVLPQDYPPES